MISTACIERFIESALRDFFCTYLVIYITDTDTMVFLPSSDKDLIIRTLADAGACGNCCHRVVGEKGFMVYLGIHQEEKVEMEGNKRAKPNACVVCVGRLQDCYMVPKLDQVVTSIIKSAEMFSLSILSLFKS